MRSFAEPAPGTGSGTAMDMNESSQNPLMHPAECRHRVGLEDNVPEIALASLASDSKEDRHNEICVARMDSSACYHGLLCFSRVCAIRHNAN